MTVDVVLVVAVTPAVGVWEFERVRTGVSGGDWLPVVVDGGAFATTKANAWKKHKQSGFEAGSPTRSLGQQVVGPTTHGQDRSANSVHQVYPHPDPGARLTLLT